MSVLEDISIAVQKGDIEKIEAKINEALELKIPASKILNNALLSGMEEVGAKFKVDAVYVPDVIIAARALNRGMSIIKPYLIDLNVKFRGKVILATVKGDLHDIGKNLVKIMLLGVGLEVIDLGTDVDDKTIVKAVLDNKPNIVALSALLTTTMRYQKVIIDSLKEAGLRDMVKIMVGGAPVNQAFAQSIGADYYTKDAIECAKVAKQIVVRGILNELT